MTRLLTDDVLVISQKAKLIETKNEYSIFDASGAQIGSIRELEQSKTKRAVRLLSDVDQFVTHKLGVFDIDGEVVCTLVRPAKVMKSTIKITDAAGSDRGSIVQGNVVGKKHFKLVDGQGDEVGTIDAENWRSWDFAIHDATGAEVGRVTKKWKGILKEGFTTADTYALKVEAAVSDDLRMMMLASAAGLDVALKQDSG